MSTIAQVAWTVREATRELPTGRAARLLMRRDEVFRIDARFRRISVLYGTAWITRGGEDLLVRAGESAALPASRGDFPLLSGVGDELLVVELAEQG